MKKTKHILIIEDHPVTRDGIHLMIRNILSEEVSISEAGTIATAKFEIQQKIPTLVMLDLMLPDGNGTELVRYLNAKLPAVKIIIFSQLDNTRLLKKLESMKVEAIINKCSSNTEIQIIIKKVLDSDVGTLCTTLDATLNTLSSIQNKAEGDLSKRETQVLKLILQGNSTLDIATYLGCSYQTIKSHRKNIYAKTKVKNAAELGAWASSLQ